MSSRRRGIAHCKALALPALLCLAVLGGCSGAGADVNEPLAAVGEAPRLGQGYRLGTVGLNANSGTMILLAFSGGGKRSSAFSYGALEGLAGTRVEAGAASVRLLDQIAAISSVSGGSFTAAYYGLYRDRIFKDFVPKFLRLDLAAYIYGTYLAPWNWRWMVDINYGTNDRMAEVYDRLLFGEARYADLMRRGPPIIMLQATDVGLGTVFPFTQDQFDLICSDLGQFPLARAVAASNGFPVLFTPITLENHADRCRGQLPRWVTSAEAVQDKLSIRRHLAGHARRYLDSGRTPYVHLLDGGISDNLALRGYIELLTRLSDDLHELDAREVQGLRRIRRVLVLSIDGQASADSSWPQRRSIGGITQIFSAVSGTQIDRYNIDTLNAMRTGLQRFKASLVNIRCKFAARIEGYACADVDVFFDHLALVDIPDPAIRNRLSQIPTGLTIEPHDIDLLIKAGRSAVFGSRVIRDFVRSYRLPLRLTYGDVPNAGER